MEKATLEKVKTAVKRAVRVTKPKAKAKAHRFSGRFGQAQSVKVAGSFNAWNPETMQPGPDGDWKLELMLPAGHYEYKYVVDGDWQLDPQCPHSADDGCGNVNSVLKID